ncbi:2-oxoglutarate dehydrogenase E1 component [Geobacter sp. DSM 9736]|uniref:2-oxoglutarate dehydrogenase E1 component n=1 Tax=Geobacter sp. DSM 9736 TaxID=1277350 RepID=UPI000B508DD3|nr:2-oxoglutarate dehydrogenase E1 component [Geobacter sp. DSM 9736]SNB47937.1 2-oxoglutarate dehydrogenase E1 component [Geobacter sp. DSM 9736]
MGFFGNTSPQWLEAQYLLWLQDPSLVTRDLRIFFDGFGLCGDSIHPEEQGPRQSLKSSGVQSLIYRYRDIGHLLACTDPLSPCKTHHPLLDLSQFELDSSDLDHTFHTRRFMSESATLRDILGVMQETYCRSIGVEFMHIQAPAERQWLIDRMEPNRNRPALSFQERLAILGRLVAANQFEAFLQRKFIGQTRFSLEGGETLVPVLEEVVSRSARAGVFDIVIGMPHRGRLTVLSLLLGMPPENIFAEFRDGPGHGVGAGDVKYHLGFSADLDRDGRRLHVTLAANPSHLEAIDAVVEGKCRARQDLFGMGGARGVLPLLIHGDAAFSGQGVVAETFNLSQLRGFSTGGTFHIVVNNQIGFTTRPADARSTCYATDMAKAVSAPIFHVHGEDPEAAVHAARLALDYRQEFGRDVVLELICYRRYGHNEGDEPAFTQPLMYRHISSRPTVPEIYAARLRQDGMDPPLRELTEGEVARLERAFAAPSVDADRGFGGSWSRVAREYDAAPVDTRVSRKELEELADAVNAIPEGFSPHPKVRALFDRRREALRSGEGVDWGNAEALAFGSLLREGTSIRLSGQDAGRGTFSHRHGIVYDQETERAFTPLDQASSSGARFELYDSMLSEYAVLGFEYGYSIESPDVLTLWEAQYGDFANGAQVIIDQFIAAAETKWQRVSGLTMLLPHGYEGQGPEHSSARIERFLELCAGNNIIVANPTTPAQYFHLLRRQARQSFRKPLVVFTPKSLLRSNRCVSSVAELAGEGFREVLVTAENRGPCRAVLICSGKLFYELSDRRERDKRDDVAIVRVEQLYPLRTDLLREAFGRFPEATFSWVQEEPANMGPWPRLRYWLSEILGKEPRYVGREEDASPAAGYRSVHLKEQEKLVAEAFA